jgi:HlyD family secretion protein
MTATPETLGPASDYNRMLRSTAITGYLVAGLFLLGIGGWAVGTSLSGAVIAPGQFVAETNLKKVQHQTGGIVAELRVREGQRVEEGEVAIRLDDTVAKANLQIVQGQIDELEVRNARLRAERDGASEIVLPPPIDRRLADREVAALVEGERRFFQSRTNARTGAGEQLVVRIGQLRDEIQGLTDQREAVTRQAVVVKRDLDGIRQLFEQRHANMMRLVQVERDHASLDGQHAQLTAQIAQARGKIAEIELQILQLTRELTTEATKELRENLAKLAELQERRVAADDQLRRMEIRAPASGIVHQLAVHTVGGVITPADPAMLIVPTEELLFLEARVAPADVDQIALGQPARVKIHAFNQRTTPELEGVLSRVGGDVVREAQTGAAYYVVRVSIAPEELARIAPLKILAGMQADVFVETTRRTPLSFLLRPIQDQLERAFRER